MVPVKVRRQWRNDILKRRYAEQGLALQYGKHKMIKYIPSKEFLKMSEADQKKSLEWKRKIDLLFDFVNPIDRQEFDVIFYNINNLLCVNHAIYVNINRLINKYSLFFFFGLGFNVDYELYGMIHLFFSYLYEMGITSINGPLYSTAAVILYNKAVNLGLTDNPNKINKKYLVDNWHISEKSIENLCQKMNVSFDNTIFEDVDVNIYELESQLTPEIKKRIEETDWKKFLQSLLPERDIKDFKYRISYAKNVSGKYGHYSSANSTICFFIYMFRNTIYRNVWNKAVDTMIHEFCHHLESCNVFSHYEREHQRTHTPLFYAAIKILQNKSILMGINLSDAVYDLSELEKDCSVESLEILCHELGVEYKDVKNLKKEE